MGTLLTLLPIAILITGVFIPKYGIKISAATSFFVTLLIGFFIWDLPPLYLGAALAKGALTAFDISLIVFGALTFLYLMHYTQVFSSIEQYLHTLSPDIRVQVILLAWFFGAFLEGSAGFGIPALMIAPLLFKLGIPAIFSVVIALVANSVPVTFGAIGAPIKIGFLSYNHAEIAQNTALLGALIAVFVPLMLLAILTTALKQPKQFFNQGIVFALFTGVAFAIPYFFAQYISIEVPSFFGAIVGTIIIFTAIRLNLPILPKNIHKLNDVDFTKRPLPVYKIIAPYFLVVCGFTLTRFYAPEIIVNLPENLNHTLRFSNSGIIFFIIFLVTASYEKISFEHLFSFIKQAFLKIPHIALIIFLIVSTIQILVVSQMIFTAFQNLATSLLPIYAPFIGAFGGFIVGSATISNLVFGDIQAFAATTAGFSISFILALQLLGATAGNMLSIPNIIMAQSSVNLKHEEGTIIKEITVWSFFYVCLIIFFSIILGAFTGFKIN